MTIAIAAGWRHLNLGPDWWPALDRFRESYRVTEIWHGACSLREDPHKLAGADAGVETWALERGLAVQRFPAPWVLFKAAGLNAKAAGARRVADMFAGRRGYVVPHSRHDPDYDPSSPIVTTEEVQGRPEILLALPGYSGTRGTIREAVRLGVPVEEVSIEPWVINRWHYRQPDGSFEFPPDTVSVMRGTRLGNPFWVGQRLGVAIDLLGAEAVAKVVPSLERAHPLAGDECLELYRLHLWIKIHHEQDRGVLAAMRQIGPKSKLCCACLRPDGTGFCHAQIVVRAWRHLNGRGQPDAPDRSKPRKTEGAPAAAASPSGAREHVGPSSQGAPPHSSR
mgnify:CR=1 FL=1